ncbi:hypothetical protein WBP07_13025 [Novosphingobium sp. BL-8A]|uniref:hypothetical protein n=1 Tax=Novosphingobium sp. BL-8A TaxID=3127639 RepID=UPI003757A01C
MIMRIRSTLAFSAALAEYERLQDAWIQHPEWKNDLSFTPEEAKVLQGNMLESADAVLKARAVTSHDIVQKLSVMLDHVDDDDRGFGWRQIERDIEATARPEPGPDMRSAFKVWRTAWWDTSVYDLSETRQDDEADRLHDIMVSAMESIFRVPCATAGDFMVKAYVNLLWHAGHTNTAGPRRAGTGNLFDVDLSEINSDSLITDKHYRSVYDDLDHCDLGACLLSCGTIHFDPEEWMLAADRIGMPVTLVVQPNGRQGVARGMVETDDERLRREERRLQRIMSFEHDVRWELLANYLKERRPDCVLHAPARAAA